MSHVHKIFTCDDTIWVENEEKVEELTSLEHDYANGMLSTIEYPPKFVSSETLYKPCSNF
jgi:hypothetical protein